MIKLNHLFIFLGFLFLLVGCGSEKSGEASLVDNVLGEREEERIWLESGVQQMPVWTSYWQELDPGFRQEDFSFERSELFEELEWPEENYITEESPFFPYLLPQPEGEGMVDIYSYKVFVPAEGRPGFQPDSEVIYFKENGLRERLLFVGPSGGFDEALWISPDHLLVAGYFEEEEGFTPKIWIIDVLHKRYSIFKHPIFTTNFDRHGYLKRKLSNIDF